MTARTSAMRICRTEDLWSVMQRSRGRAW